MAISPDGKHVAVSASTGNVVHILDTRTGLEVGRFPSGDSPHENNYSADGKPDLPRQHRARLHPRRPAGVRYDQGRPLVPDRQCQHEPDHSADRHGPEARGGGVPEHELGGQADGAVAERESRSTSRSRSSTASSSTTSSRPRHPRRPPAEPGPADPARAVPARLRAPRHRDERRGDQALRRRHDVGLRGDRVAQELPLQADQAPARSPTGPRPARTAATATSPGAAATRSR